MSMKGLCHTCYKSNQSIILDAKSGFGVCTPCIKKTISVLPELKCSCKDCSFHNPELQSNPIEEPETIITQKESVEG